MLSVKQIIERRKLLREIDAYIVDNPEVSVADLCTIFNRKVPAMKNVIKQLKYKKKWVYIGDDDDS